MVSLISRNDYLNACQSDPYLKALADFIQEKEIEFNCQDHLNNANDLAICALKAINHQDREDFVKVFSTINQRSPKKESDWIFNDLLVFCCLLGVKKFEVDDSWIREVLEIRRINSNNETQQINDTFWAILNDSFEGKNNFHILLINFKKYLNIPISDADHLSSIYLDLVATPFPAYKSGFLNILMLGALDAIVMQKGLINIEESQLLKKFHKGFRKRIRQLSFGIWATMLLFSFILTAIFIYRFAIAPSQQADIIGRVVDSIGFLGFGGLVPFLLNKKNNIITIIEKPFFRFFDYFLDSFVN